MRAFVCIAFGKCVQNLKDVKYLSEWHIKSKMQLLRISRVATEML